MSDDQGKHANTLGEIPNQQQLEFDCRRRVEGIFSV